MYSNIPLGTLNPGCIVILVDQSWAMLGSFGDDGSKAEQVAQAVNRVLEEFVIACWSAEKIRDRLYVPVIGYGAQNVHKGLWDFRDKFLCKKSPAQFAFGFGVSRATARLGAKWGLFGYAFPFVGN